MELDGYKWLRTKYINISMGKNMYITQRQEEELVCHGDDEAAEYLWVWGLIFRDVIWKMISLQVV